MICYIGIGSNIGDRSEYIRKSIALLKKRKETRVLRISPVYETEPVGGPGGQGRFLNLVVKLSTDLSCLDLLSILKMIERKAGRKLRKTRWSAREIDLDILFYGNRIVNKGNIRIPHPLLHKRLFVLKPLSDIAPKLKHPIFKITVRELLEDLKHETKESIIEKVI